MRKNQPSDPASSARLLRTQGMGADPLDQGSEGWVVWGSLFLVFLLSLLPWRLLEGVPDLLMLVLAFWAVHEPRRIGLVTAFLLGLLVDVHDAGPLGQYALTYLLACYGGIVLHRRLWRFDLWRQALHMLPVLVASRALSVLICAVLTGSWPGWSWLIGLFVTSILWVPIGWLLLLPGNRITDLNSQVN